MSSFSTYFFPKFPDVWTLEDIERVKPKYGALKGFSVLLTIISTIGLLITGYKIARLKWNKTLIPPAIIYAAITSLAVYILGIIFDKLGDRQFKGLTDKRRADIAFEELKKEIEKLPVCVDQNDLDQKLKTEEFGLQILEGMNKVNAIYQMVQTLYIPTQDIQPHFVIFSEDLSIEQQLDLLDAAYKKGILLDFTSPVAKIAALEVDYLKLLSEELKNPFELSMKYIERRLQNKDDRYDRMNAQLKSLALKCISPSDRKILSPNFQFESDGTLAIRSRFSEIVDPRVILELAPHVKQLKIEKSGFIQPKGSFSEAGWNAMEKAFQDKYPNKIIFFSEENGEASPIWQTNPTFHSQEEISNAIQEDTSRRRRLKIQADQQKAQAAA